MADVALLGGNAANSPAAAQSINPPGGLGGVGQVSFTNIVSALQSNGLILSALVKVLGNDYISLSGNNVFTGTNTFQGVTTLGAVKLAYVIKTTNYTINPATDYFVICETNAFTVTLPTAVGIGGQCFSIKNANTVSSGYNITLATTSSQTIDGVAPGIIIPLQALTLTSDNVNWWIN